MRNRILQAVDSVINTAFALKESEAVDFIEKASQWITDCFRKRGKLLIAGNGGSLCDAMHFAEELTGQFRQLRAALPAIALSDPGQMSCIANDMGFESIFSRGVEALGQPGDIFVVLTTSGNSQNLIAAVKTAKIRGLQSIAFSGKGGGAMRGLCDLEWIVPGLLFSDRIQEAHMAVIHILIEQIENDLFYAEQNFPARSIAY